MTGQNISTATGYTTVHDAGVPLQADPANIVRAFTEYHYGPNYTGGADPTSGIDYHLKQKATKANPSLTGSVTIGNSGTQLILQDGSSSTKASISTNTGLITGAATNDLSINSTGSKILLGISGTEKVRIDSTGVSILTPSQLNVTGTAAFTGATTAPTMAISDNSTRVATTAYATSRASATASSLMTNSQIDQGPHFNLANAIELYQPIGNGTTVTQIGTAVGTVGTAQAANVTSTLTNFVTKGRRVQYSTTGTAGLTASIRNGLAQYSQDNGYLFYAKFAPQSTRPASASRGFFGMWGTTTQFPNAAVNTLTNMYGLGWEAGDTVYYWYNNDGSGAAVRTAVGGASPITIRTDDLVELIIHAYNNQYIDMIVRINNKVNGTFQETKTLTQGTDEMPATSTLMSWHLAIGNGAAAAIYTMDINKVLVRAQDIRTNDTSSVYANALLNSYLQDY